MKAVKLTVMVAALCVVGTLFAVVDDNLPWKWDDSGRVAPPAPVEGEGTLGSAFSSWICTVADSPWRPGFMLLFR